MAKRAEPNRLSVWMNGELVGHWTVTRAGHQWQYAPTWLDSPRARFLSLSLPFTPGNVAHRGTMVLNYFDNLLPDRPDIRNRLRDRFRTASAGTFDLLAEVGRDCVGALQLLPEEETPQGLKSITGVPLDDETLEQDLQVAGGLRLPFANDFEDLRLSIAGAQEKTAFLWKDERWNRPLGSTPSTHIFKLPLGTIGGRTEAWEGSLENEWLCSQILAAYGLSVASSSLARFGQQKALIVERFDRRLAPDQTWWQRLPMEDFCQALGLSPGQKYEGDGGPGMKDVLRILEGSENRSEDRENFFTTQILFWLLAAPDGHAKNFSLFLGPQGRYRSTPLYDILSAYPWIGPAAHQIPRQKLRMAMAVRGKNPHDRWDQIHRQHWDHEARRLGLGPSASRFVDRILDRTPDALALVERNLPKDFPDPIATAILGGIREAALRLGEMKPE